MIDPYGVIKTATKFNRQIKDTYTLMIRVFDNGTPPMYADVNITVIIIEESSFPPTVSPLGVSITVSDDSFPGGVISQVKAFDRDAYDQLLFSIVANDNVGHLFEIDPLDGTVRAVQSLDAGEYVVNVSVSDGKFIRYADVRLVVESISPDMSDNAVVVRLERIVPQEFVSGMLRGFLTALKTELAVREKDIKILSIQPVIQSSPAPPRMRKRGTDSNLDVLLAVQKSQNKFYRGNALKRRLESAQETLQQQAGIRIIKVFNNVCTKDSCIEGECNTVFRLKNDQPVRIQTDKEGYVFAQHTLTAQCTCKPGATGEKVFVIFKDFIVFIL